jgi:hypothetical protein
MLHENDSLITRYKILKGERDESYIFTIIIALVVKLGLVAPAFYLLLGSTIDWSSWKTYAAMLIFGAFLKRMTTAIPGQTTRSLA